MNHLFITQFLSCKSCKQLLLIAVLLFISVNIAYADTSPDLPTEADAPVDGGLSVLIAGGIGYAARRLKSKSNNMD